MNGKGKVRFDFVDVYGDRPDDRADIFLQHTVLSDSRVIRDHRTSKRLQLPNLDSTQGGTYRVQVLPMRHRAVSRFVRINEGKIKLETFVLPADPKKVTGVQFPSFDSLPEDLKQILGASNVEGLEGEQGAALYAAIDNFRKAGLLNIYSKMKATRFLNGRDVFSYMVSLTRLRGDRFFASVRKELRDETKNATLNDAFHEAPGQAHTPPPGFVLVDSFKTRDKYGNLQLTFFARPESLEFMIDADIDDAQGVEHIFQVVSHALTGSESHPYDIHEILKAHQNIDPGYRLVG